MLVCGYNDHSNGIVISAELDGGESASEYTRRESLNLRIALRGWDDDLEMVAGQVNDGGYFEVMKTGRSLQLYSQYTTGLSSNQS